MSTIEWRAPAPIWSKQIASAALLRPGIAACSGDTFLDDFLALMRGEQSGRSPHALAGDLLPAGGTQKLFQPGHGSYYLLVGSLVCRQLGLPDRLVDRAAGESVGFVVRRLLRDERGALVFKHGVASEEAWQNDGPQRGWHPLAAADKLHEGEERLPMHHVEACAAYQAGESPFADAFGLSECGRRSVVYGYIPVSNRQKYAERRPVESGLSPAAEFQRYVASVAASGEPGHDPRMDEVEGRVLAPWRGVYADVVTQKPIVLPPPGQRGPTGVLALYLLLDLADVLGRNLPSVYAALGSDGSSLAAASERRKLFDRLRTITTIQKSDGNRPLTDILNDLKDKLALVQDGADDSNIDEGDFNALSTAYELVGAAEIDLDALKTPSVAADGLHTLFTNALAEQKTEQGANWLPAPTDERLALLRAQVVPRDDSGEPVYVLRMVYERTGCCPVVSAPTGRVTFAPFFDPDAPARPIRIELPSIKPRDLRKYKRGVGLEMSPELRDLMNRVHKGMLKDEGLTAGASWQLGMICSFSLQIIFLVAFIVMFIFLILLNIVFWWLPFLKICFPIPVKGK